MKTVENKKCRECVYCVDLRNLGNTRGSYFCNHPDKEHIHKYFAEHRIRKMERFIDYGKVFEDGPSIKTSPAWCPDKKA